MAAESVEIRLARLEGVYQQVNERLRSIEERLENGLESLRQDLGQRISRLEEKVDRQFYWVVGLILVSMVLPIALRFLPLP